MSNQPENSVQSTKRSSKFSFSRLLSKTSSSGPDSTGGAPSTENWRVPDAYTGSFDVTVGSPEPVFEEGWEVDDFVIALVADLVTEDPGKLQDVYAFDIRWKDQKLVGPKKQYPCQVSRLSIKSSKTEGTAGWAITGIQHKLLQKSVNQTYNVSLKLADYSMKFTRNMAYENIGQEKQHSLSVDLIKKDKPEVSA